MKPEYSDITGYLIAGGQSSRFGSDKRMVEFEGEPLLEKAVRLMHESLGELPVLVGDDVMPRSDGTWRVITDARPQAGPLGGLVAALDDCGTDWILAFAVDMPLMKPDDLKLLVESRNDEFDALTLSIDGRPEPLAALYHSRTAPFWWHQLERGKLSLHEGIALLNWSPIRLPSNSKSLTNINRLDDLRALDP